jgi:hypothetical protein
MRRSMVDRLANLERALRADPEVTVELAPWVRRRLKALGRSPSSLLYQAPRAPQKPVGEDPADREDVRG